jgi:glycosyltransferase involved in cell wall biosynthesis
MHILICAVSSARNPSGICRHAANLATSLSSAPDVSRVSLLVGHWQVRYFHDIFGLQHKKLDVLPINIRNNSYARNFWYWRTLPVVAREMRPDVIQLSFPVPFVRHRFLCPVISSLHDLYPYDIPQNFGTVRAFFNRLFLRQCLRESDRVVCSSNFTLDRVQRVTPDLAIGKTTRIYQSVTLDPERCRNPNQPELDGRDFLLTVAQHRRNKNLGLLLSAFAELRRRDERYSRMLLIIVGSDGPETKTLLSLIQRLSLQGHVLFTSALQEPELGWLYRKCRLVVAPSSIEGFGLPVAEAQRCGSPLLCSDIPVFREVAGPRCHYFELKQEQPGTALADAIEAALLESRAEPQALQAFSPNEIASQHLAVYLDVIANSAVPRFISSRPESQAVSYDSYAG